MIELIAVGNTVFLSLLHNVSIFLCCGWGFVCVCLFVCVLVWLVLLLLLWFGSVWFGF